MAAADSRESTWIRLEIRERIRACARECPCEIAVSRPRRVALCIAPPRRPRRMAFQRSRSRVAQLDPLAWIIESRSITTPRPVINPTPSYLIRVWPRLTARSILRSTHFSTPFSRLPGQLSSIGPSFSYERGSQRNIFLAKWLEMSFSEIRVRDFDYTRS